MRRIIIVGAPERVRGVVRAAGEEEDVVVFSSLAELDRWREAQVADETFGPDLVAALDEIGCPLDTLPRRLRRQSRRWPVIRACLR